MITVKTGRVSDMHALISYFRLSDIHIRTLLRNPVCLLIAFSTVVLTLILPLAFAHTFGNTAIRLARDGGLSFQIIAGITIAAYAACSITGRERQSGTEGLILSKPVSPGMIFLARYAAIASILFLFSAAAGTATMLAGRIAETFTVETGYRIDITTASIAIFCVGLAGVAGILLNLFRHASFHTVAFCLLPLLLVAAAGLTGFYNRAGVWSAAVNYSLDLSIIPAALTIYAALLMFCAIALTLARSLSPVSVIVACLAILAAGLASEWLLATTLTGTAARWAMLVLVPDWQLFWSPGDSATLQNAAPHQGAAILLYACLYTAALLTVGCHLFKQSEHA